MAIISCRVTLDICVSYFKPIARIRDLAIDKDNERGYFGDYGRSDVELVQFVHE